jgi:hypothetical protein
LARTIIRCSQPFNWIVNFLCEHTIGALHWHELF